MTDETGAAPALPFWKMHGIGNDFVVVDVRGGDDPIDPALARAVGDRRRGVGFDQLIVIRESGERAAAAAIDFWNSDGSLSGACGNGARCVAQLLMEEAGVETLSLRTERGLLACERTRDGRVCVNMGAPRLDWRDIPLAEAHDTRRIDVKLGPIDDPALWGPGAVNMGNPHAVFFVDDVAATPVAKLGALLEHHPMFPERANIGFAQVRSRHEIRLRVWERGAGLTLACGSGACAAVVAGVRRGLLDRIVSVEADGGRLDVEWDEETDDVWLAGPTAMVFAGALSPAFLAEARDG